MTMMPRAMLIVWLTPVRIDGIAWGSCTLNSNWLRVEPNTCPASTVSVGTWRIPNAVSRTTGAIAYTTVATAAGTGPMPKNSTAGTRKAVDGTVCMASSTGLMNA